MTRVGQKKLTIQGPACTAKAWARTNKNKPKQEQAKTRTSLICIPRSLSVSDNMTRVGRKKLTIQGPACTAKAWARTNKNKPKQEQAKTRTSLICIPRSLSVSNNMTRVGRKKLTIQGPVWSESVGDSSKSVGDNKQAKYVYLVL